MLTCVRDEYGMRKMDQFCNEFRAKADWDEIDVKCLFWGRFNTRFTQVNFAISFEVFNYIFCDATQKNRASQ